jgi:hypothetical protein
MTAIRYVHHAKRPFHIGLITVRLPAGILPFFVNGGSVDQPPLEKPDTRSFSAQPA